MDFVRNGNIIGSGIFFSTVYTDINISPYALVLSVIEGDNVGECVVAKKAFVDAVEIVIAAKNVVDIPNRSFVVIGSILKPDSNGTFVNETIIAVFSIKVEWKLFDHLS